MKMKVELSSPWGEGGGTSKYATPVCVCNVFELITDQNLTFTTDNQTGEDIDR
jgi:hypothetical protein